MSLLGDALSLMFGKRTVTETIFIKDFNKYNEQLRDLEELSQRVVSNKKELIKRDIAFLKYGIEGEQNVYYELKNSFIPMLCLHDIRLEYDNYVAQFDFIIITNKFLLVLETKKLSGDIEINSDGDFIRIIKNNAGKVLKKEGMYSPVSQNERHVNILRDILLKQGLIKTLPVKSMVVIANPKTILDKQKCPKNLHNSICKYDQLITFLNKELNDKNNDKNVLEKYLFGIPDFLIKNNKPLKIDYISKYSLGEDDFIKVEQQYKIKVVNSPDETAVYSLLKKYRLKVSKEEGLKAYMVFSNQELDLLVQNKPKNKKELLKVKGFGEKKVEKYGEAILAIINNTEKKL